MFWDNPKRHPTDENCLLYIRFSTPDQRNGNSLERQLERTRDYCRRNHLKKGSLGDFLQRVKAGLISNGTALVIENLDRLSRQGIRVTRQLIEHLTDAGIDVHVVSISRIFRAGFENDLTDYMVLGVESEVRGEAKSIKPPTVKRLPPAFPTGSKLKLESLSNLFPVAPKLSRRSSGLRPWAWEHFASSTSLQPMAIVRLAMLVGLRAM